MIAVIRDIVTTRGDSFTFDFRVNNPIAPLREAYFSIKKDLQAENYVLQLKIGDGITELPDSVYRVKIPPDITLWFPNESIYDLQLEFVSDIYTPIKGRFIVQWHVTDDKEVVK